MNILPPVIRKSIQNKLFASFLTVLLLLVAVIAVSFSIIGNLGKASDKILKMNYNSIIASIRMMDDLESIHREFLSDTGTTLDSSSMGLAKAQNSFSKWLGRSQDNITEVGEEQILAEIDSLFSYYLSEIRLSPSHNLDQARMEHLNKLRIKVKNGCLQLLQLNQNAMFTKSMAAQKIARKGSTTLFIVALFVMMVGILLSWGLSKRIVSPIVKLKHATNKIANGDYSVELIQESEDELGMLTSDFDQMAGKLRGFNDLNVRKIIAEQQKIEAIFANIEDGIFFIGSDYSILDANMPALNAFSLNLKDVIGHHFLEIIKHDRLFDDLKNCLESRKATEYPDHDNFLTIRQGDKQIYFEYSFSPIMSLQSELLGVMFLLHDITTLKELDRLKSEFVMIVSHELKTPLTSLNMSIDLLKESLGSEPKPEDVELIRIAKEEITRLRLMINDLLDLSKIEAGKIDMHFAVADPDAMLDAVVRYFQNQADELNVIVEKVSVDNVGSVWCDEDKLMLVFSNLVSNALKSIGKEGRITLTAEASGNYIIFCVKDNGKGIPLSYQNKIFDRFVQVGEQNNAGGTGLGLTISKEIVRAHGGSIWVESDSGQGASFYFTIPKETASIKPT